MLSLRQITQNLLLFLLFLFFILYSLFLFLPVWFLFADFHVNANQTGFKYATACMLCDTFLICLCFSLQFQHYLYMETIIATLEKHILICFLQLIVCEEQAALISEVCEEFWQTNHRLHSCNSCKIILCLVIFPVFGLAFLNFEIQSVSTCLLNESSPLVQGGKKQTLKFLVSGSYIIKWRHKV